MKRLIMTLAIIMVLGMIAIPAMAATNSEICPVAPDRYHRYNNHRGLMVGYSVDAGNHFYRAYVLDGSSVWKNDCRLTENYEYCENYCSYCGATCVGSQHSHLRSTSHSISHN